MPRSVLDRRFRETWERRQAEHCPHPSAARLWQAGDAMTPDRLVCAQCFTPLAERPHAPGAPRRTS